MESVCSSDDHPFILLGCGCNVSIFQTQRPIHLKQEKVFHIVSFTFEMEHKQMTTNGDIRHNPSATLQSLLLSLLRCTVSTKSLLITFLNCLVRSQWLLSSSSSFFSSSPSRSPPHSPLLLLLLRYLLSFSKSQRYCECARVCLSSVVRFMQNSSERCHSVRRRRM